MGKYGIIWDFMGRDSHLRRRCLRVLGDRQHGEPDNTHHERKGRLASRDTHLRLRRLRLNSLCGLHRGERERERERESDRQYTIGACMVSMRLLGDGGGLDQGFLRRRPLRFRSGLTRCVLRVMEVDRTLVSVN